MTPILRKASSRLSSEKEKANLFNLVGKKVTEQDVSLEVIKLALSSVAELSIVPFQDVLGLGAEARMNNPSQPTGNWQWRVTANQLASSKFVKLADLTANYLRC